MGDGRLRVGMLAGSVRKKSLSRAVAGAACDLVPAGMIVEFLPHPASLPHFDQDLMDESVPSAVSALVDAVTACDAILIVTPEYNWSFPGTLKNAIDWLSRFKPNPLENKPVAIWAVSPGILGGARLHEGLRQVLHSQGMRIMARPEVQVAGAAGKVDVEQGKLTDSATASFLTAHLERFLEFARR